MLKLKIKEENENLHIELKGDLDIDGTEIINELIPKMLTYNNVNIDFKAVPFVDSSGMGILMTLVQTLAANQTSVIISNVQREVFEIFNLLQIPDILGKDIFV
ncbi:STAS domain-containing protein [Psychrobacillus sp. PGGUH221]|uniref:STAS domain-containing protein n=1 Tax=Psychrobacillus sp. PGGUH221 TaxID=3020058 RepID=UPI0035C7152E